MCLSRGELKSTIMEKCVDKENVASYKFEVVWCHTRYSVLSIFLYRRFKSLPSDHFKKEIKSSLLIDVLVFFAITQYLSCFFAAFRA